MQFHQLHDLYDSYKLTGSPVSVFWCILWFCDISVGQSPLHLAGFLDRLLHVFIFRGMKAPNRQLSLPRFFPGFSSGSKKVTSACKLASSAPPARSLSPMISVGVFLLFSGRDANPSQG